MNSMLAGNVSWSPYAGRLPWRSVASIVFGMIAVLGGTRPGSCEGLAMRPVAKHAAGLFAQSAAEIPAYCPDARRVFVVNAETGRVDVLTLDGSGGLTSAGFIDAAKEAADSMKAVNSVSVSKGTLAVAIEAEPNTDPGVVAFYDTATLKLKGTAPAGALPDMVAFSPDGEWALVANEGEPSEDYSVDPEGTVTIIDLHNGFERPPTKTVTFRDWNAEGPRACELPDLMARGLRHFGRVTLSRSPVNTRPATFAEDVEPEWIEIDSEGRLAYVCLQEANAIAEIDINAAVVKRIIPLGFKDHGDPGNELDVSDKDGGANIRAWPGLYGAYQPDTIRLFVKDGRRYIVTANEGDSRVRPLSDDAIDGVKEGGIFNDEAALKDWDVKGTPFEEPASGKHLGRLKLIRDLVDRHRDKEGRPTKLFSFGGRSFSIFDVESGDLVFDSGGDFERITAARNPEHFNVSNDSLEFEKRSRSKGPEPEGLVLGEIDGKTFAFIGLERTGGIMVYDITEPSQSRHVGYFTNRRFDQPMKAADGSPNPEAGDTGPEGLIFVSRERSPTGKPLVIVGNETSGSTTVWEVVGR